MSEIITLTKRTLEELLEMLPTDAVWKGQEMGFGVTKYKNNCTCFAFDAFTQLPLFLDRKENIRLEWQATTPAIAVSMMIGWLKTQKLI